MAEYILNEFDCTLCFNEIEVCAIHNKRVSNKWFDRVYVYMNVVSVL